MQKKLFNFWATASGILRWNLVAFVFLVERTAETD
jgi:hypothetical protein